MSEEEKIEEEVQSSPKNVNDGIQRETVSELDRADQIAERQKRENDRREELINREEALAARRIVGGNAEAGSVREQPKKESPSEYRRRVEKEMAEGKTEW